MNPDKYLLHTILDSAPTLALAPAPVPALAPALIGSHNMHQASVTIEAAEPNLSADMQIQPDMPAEDWSNIDAFLDAFGPADMPSSSTPRDLQVRHLEVQGNATVWGNLWAHHLELSDASLKTDVADAPSSALQKLQQLRPRTYTLLHSLQKELGLVAQEVAPVLPEAVALDETSGLLAIKLYPLLVHNVQATQELYKQLQGLDAQVRAMQDDDQSNLSMPLLLLQDCMREQLDSRQAARDVPSNDILQGAAARAESAAADGGASGRNNGNKAASASSDQPESDSQQPPSGSQQQSSGLEQPQPKPFDGLTEVEDIAQYMMETLQVQEAFLGEKFRNSLNFLGTAPVWECFQETAPGARPQAGAASKLAKLLTKRKQNITFRCANPWQGPRQGPSRDQFK